MGFSLGQLPFGHVIPLGIVAGCGVGGEEKQGRAKQGKVGKKGGRSSGVGAEQGVADRKRENKRQVFVNEGGRDVQADDAARPRASPKRLDASCARPPLYVLTRLTTDGNRYQYRSVITLSMYTTTDYSFPRLRNLFGSSTCLDRMNSATFFPKKSYELEQLTPRSR
jgi:hypothetical protein